MATFRSADPLRERIAPRLSFGRGIRGSSQGVGLALLLGFAFAACAKRSDPSTSDPASAAASSPDNASDNASERPPSVAPERDDPPGSVRVGASLLTIVYEGREPPLPREVIRAWIKREGETVADYLGGFPVPSLEVTVVSRPRRGGVVFGTHNDGRWIRLFLGSTATERSLEGDWVLIHEMLHAAFPDLDADHSWMQEGLSTYLEPIVRARRGDLSEERVWAFWVDKMGYGRPRPGDRGLDHTHTWGRTYWGGAIFWMMVDVELRRETGNRQGLGDAIRGVLRAGGNGREHWSTDQVARVCDRSTGTKVVSRLYAEMAEAPGDVDLDALWRRLGVHPQADGSVELDDTAPDAAIRRAITAPPAGAP